MLASEIIDALTEQVEEFGDFAVDEIDTFEQTMTVEGEVTPIVLEPFDPFDP